MMRDLQYYFWTQRGKTRPVVLTNNHPPYFHASALLNQPNVQRIYLLFACGVKIPDNIHTP